MKRLDRRLRLVALVALAACGTEDPPVPGTTGGTGGGSGGTGGGGTSGTGGTAMARQRRLVHGRQRGMGGTGGTRWHRRIRRRRSAPRDGRVLPLQGRQPLDLRDQGAVGASPTARSRSIVRMEAVGGTGPHAAKQVFRVETRKYGRRQPQHAGGRHHQLAAARGEQDRALPGDQLHPLLGDADERRRRSAAAPSTSRTTGIRPRLRLDERPTGRIRRLGMTWPETYTEYKNTYNYASNPPMVTPSIGHEHRQLDRSWRPTCRSTVPAGTFNNCIVVQKRTVGRPEHEDLYLLPGRRAR